MRIKIQKYNLASAFLTAIVFLYIFNPHIFGIAAHIYLLPLSIVYLVINVKTYSKVISNRLLFTYLITLTLVIITSFSIELLNSRYLSFSYFWRFFTYLISIFVIGLSIIIYFIKKRVNEKYILNLFIKVAILQSFFALAMIIIPELRNFIYNNVFQYSSDFKIYEGFTFSRRAFGVTQEYLFAMPIFMGWVLSIVMIDMLLNSKTISHNIYRLGLIILFIIIILYNARIGLIAIPISIFSYYAYYGYRIMKRSNFYFTTILIVLVGTSVYVAFYKLDLLISLFIDNSTIRMTIEDFIINDGITRYLEIYAKSHIHIPDSLFSLIFGEGEYLFSNPRSDIGFINYLYFGGIFLSLIIYVPLIYLVIKVHYLISLKMKIILTTGLLLIFFSNVKGLVFGANDIMMAYNLLLLFILLRK